MKNETELDLKELLEILKGRIVLIITVTIMTTFISAVVSIFFISPTYETEVSIIICKQLDGGKITNSDVVMYQNLMETYKYIAGTNKVAELSAERLGNGADAKDLLKRITVTAKAGTMILNITAKSDVAVNAYKDVQAYADAFVIRATELIPDGDVKIMDNAQIPEAPVKPNVNLIIAAAFISGLLISAGFAFLLEYMNNTIVTQKDAEKYLELSVIGIIPENNLE
jgi:Capsular polysaccharide biosynthesis protein